MDRPPSSPAADPDASRTRPDRASATSSRASRADRARRGWWLIPLRTLLLALVVGFLAGAVAEVAPRWFDPLQQRDYPPRRIGESERCPVCGMYPARFPKWRTQVVFRDRSGAAFDSAVNLFRFLNRLERYAPQRRREDVADLYLTDYDSGKWLPGDDALVVIDSNLSGPMGDAGLPAFASREAAQRFVTERGGRLLPFSAVVASPELQAKLMAGR